MGNNDKACDPPNDSFQPPKSILLVWMILATACYGAIVIIGLAALVMSPIFLDSDPNEAQVSLELLLLFLIGIIYSFVWSIVFMWAAFLKLKDYRLAFWLGVPSVVLVVIFVATTPSIQLW